MIKLDTQPDLEVNTLNISLDIFKSSLCCLRWVSEKGIVKFGTLVRGNCMRWTRVSAAKKFVWDSGCSSVLGREPHLNSRSMIFEWPSIISRIDLFRARGTRRKRPHAADIK